MNELSQMVYMRSVNLRGKCRGKTHVVCRDNIYNSPFDEFKRSFYFTGNGIVKTTMCGRRLGYSRKVDVPTEEEFCARCADILWGKGVRLT